MALGVRETTAREKDFSLRTTLNSVVVVVEDFCVRSPIFMAPSPLARGPHDLAFRGAEFTDPARKRVELRPS